MSLNFFRQAVGKLLSIKYKYYEMFTFFATENNKFLRRISYLKLTNAKMRTLHNL